MPEFTFESLQKRIESMFAGSIDLEAKFMYYALGLATIAPGYTHLTPEEVFEHLKEGIVPQQKERPFVIIVQPDGVCDYIYSAARGHKVEINKIKEIIAEYTLDNRFTIVFDLDGREPHILPNTKKNPKRGPEILQLVKELEAKNEDIPDPDDIINSDYYHRHRRR